MQRTVFWRRLDLEGLEHLQVSASASSVQVQGNLLCLEADGIRVEHFWHLSPDWRTLRLAIRRWMQGRQDALILERTGTTWRVNGAHRADLDGLEEPDLSLTPFCNTLPIRRTGVKPGDTLELDVAYVDGATLEVSRSRQKYIRLDRNRVRYIDLGLLAGFEADLTIDREGLVVTYDGLFERLFPGG
ncbi:putative glycolipid-binding domain-containing protein [Limoniibacter endophyticus]|uniref:Glycolipid-binding domain-containing protein n=1 Tax=Limoniibacter endophyticus TaxID=1565040 RepID=A0A8J3GJ25_9HYPH|nr:putative glycolipid-binding domain-containing protein [Limoniibacter endophyticus]GHC75436.1 hypothetical protein GCM10010136_25350 [Limoniibacter endophyticus]